MLKSFRLLGMVAGAGFALAASSVVAHAGERCPEVGFVLVEPTASPRTRAVKLDRDRIIQVRRDPLTTTSDLIEVKLDDQGDPALLLKFQPEAAARLEAATTNHDGIRLAFVADDEALLSVTWQGRYGLDRQGAQVSITDPDRAHQLFERLRRCVGAPGEPAPNRR